MRTWHWDWKYTDKAACLVLALCRVCRSTPTKIRDKMRCFRSRNSSPVSPYPRLNVSTSRLGLLSPSLTLLAGDAASSTDSESLTAPLHLFLTRAAASARQTLFDLTLLYCHSWSPQPRHLFCTPSRKFRKAQSVLFCLFRFQRAWQIAQVPRRAGDFVSRRGTWS